MEYKDILYTKADGIATITINRPKVYNAFTANTCEEMIKAFQDADYDKSIGVIVLTGAGDKAFCTGGDLGSHDGGYGGRGTIGLPVEELQSVIRDVSKPVIARVNGFAIGGGNVLVTICDLAIASDKAQFGQAGPRHGSAPDGGSTDFLHLFVGIGHATESCTLCEHWSAYTALRLGLVNRVVPALVHEGRFIPNPLVVTDRWVDPDGSITYGKFLTGASAQAAKSLMASCKTDLSLLDAAVEELSTKLLHTMPECLIKTIESLRKKKLEHWQRNSETNRAWLALNMMTEGRAGFRAFNEGPPGNREVDFIELRRRLARGEAWDEAMFRAIEPKKTVVGSQ